MSQVSTTFRKPSPPAVLVLEESPFWSAELSRQFIDQPVSIRMRTRVQDVVPLLATKTVSLLVVGLEIDLPSVLRLLAELRQQAQLVRTIVLLPAENLELEWTIRELGAVEVLPAPVLPGRLSHIVMRYLFHKTHQVTDTRNSG
jgi:DNA-binding NtrC family response regulator